MNLDKVDIVLKRVIYDKIVDMISKNITPNVEYERHDNPFDEIIMVDYTGCAISVNSFADEVDTIMVCPVFFDSAIPGIPAIGTATHKIKLADPDCFDKMLEAVQEYVKGR